MGRAAPRARLGRRPGDGRLRGTPVGATAEQTAELVRIEKRIAEIDDEMQKIADAEGDEQGELSELPDDHAYFALEDERETLYEGDNRIRVAIDQNVTYTPEQMACAGCLVSIDQFSGLTVQAGLVRAEDAASVPQPPQPADGDAEEAPGGGAAGAPAPDGYTPPVRRGPAKNPETEAVKSAGLSNSLAEDLRLIRNALVKTHLAHDFEAAFDLAAYEMSLHAFGSRIYGARPLAMTLNPTGNRPTGSPEELTAFEAASPGIELLERDRAELPLDWLKEEDAAQRFLAFADLPLGDRQRLFAAATAHALNKQLSFDHGAHAEIEATVARLDIPFEALWRPGRDRYWSQMRKGEMLAIARRTLGPEWAAAHTKDKKDELASSMAAAFGPDGEADTLGLSAAGRAAALSWTPAGFRAFDPARPREENAPATNGGAAAAKAAEPDPNTDDTAEPAEASGNIAPPTEAHPAGTTDGNAADAAPTTEDALNGKLPQHPAAVAVAVNGNGNGATLDDHRENAADSVDEERAATFDHEPADELPRFLRK